MSKQINKIIKSSLSFIIISISLFLPHLAASDERSASSLLITLDCLASLTSQRRCVFPMENWLSRNNSTNLWRVQAFRFRHCLVLVYRFAIQGMALMEMKPTVALTTTGVLTRIFPF